MLLDLDSFVDPHSRRNGQRWRSRLSAISGGAQPASAGLRLVLGGAISSMRSRVTSAAPIWLSRCYLVRGPMIAAGKDTNRPPLPAS